MQRSETKSKAKQQKNIEDIDTIIPLARKTSTSITTKNLDTEKQCNPTKVFTKEQEVALRKHIVKCCQTQYYRNTTIRKMIYEYAQKLPDCQYPKQWDTIKMTSVDWFLKFRSRHPGLKKTLTKKPGHCVCITGCHMGPEGKQALKELEAEVLIARVYHYLKKEYEYMTMCNDLSLLMNILRRTAEATGVCEQTITKILEEEEQNRLDLNDVSAQGKSDTSDDIPVVRKKKTAVTEENKHNSSGVRIWAGGTVNDVSAQSKSDTSDDIPVVRKKKKTAVTEENKNNCSGKRIWSGGTVNDVSAQSKSDTSDDIPVVCKKKKTAVTEEKKYNCSGERIWSGETENDVSAQSKSDTIDDTPVVCKKKTAVTEENKYNCTGERIWSGGTVNDVAAQSKSDTSDDIPVVCKKKTAVTEENKYNCSGESSNVETVDEDSCSSNNVLYSDFERLQQNPTSIKSVVVEILDEDFNETAYNHTMADQPDEPMYLMALPLPSTSNVLTEARDPAASTSGTSFAELPTIVVRKSKAEKRREYRQRMIASRTSAQAIAARKLNAERQRICRQRKAANPPLVSGSLESTTASSVPAQITVQPGTSSDQIEVPQAQSAWNTKWTSSILRFKSTFLDNDFGYACSVCDRLWFKNELKHMDSAHRMVISKWYIKEKRPCREEYEMVCNTCKRSLNKKLMPPLARVNGFSYPDQPPGLPPLDLISERLISPLLPFRQVRRLRHDISYGIIGQVINVPVDEQDVVKCLPRPLNEDDVINVNVERNLAHNSVYISGYMSKSTIGEWLTVLQKSPLYRSYKINVDVLRLNPTVPSLDDIQDYHSNRIEYISDENTPESEILASRQHTMMWNEEDWLNIAPGNQARPFNVIYDHQAEELSFPSIYFGEPRRFNTGVTVTPYMIASSEIRRRDRRGATPQKILYVAMKILRLRIMNGLNSMFRNNLSKDNVTRRTLEVIEFLKENDIQNLAFMKAVPNSVQYWASRKRDLFAMIRQLGKPTVFLTISANEIHWMKLLTILLKLSKKYPKKTAKDLNTSERCTLVSDDPVTCCIYFYKLVGSLMKMLKSKQTYNPFGIYFVKEYFLNIEFQHSGSPRAHMLLWLNEDPRETVSENMPRTIDLVEKISSVARDDVPNDSIYANQIHQHTFTCTKQGETTCRFGNSYWPMPTTRVLVPIPQSDGRLQTLQQKAKELRTSLGKCRYTSMDEFLNVNGLTNDSYLDIVRSTLRRPTLVFRRNFDELMTNTFNPYLAGEVNSNIDIQFILDEYSCAEYVVEHVNKSARGMSDLRRKVTTMMQEHPDQDYTGQLKALSIKLLNTVEMSAQEAAWYLLQLPMSETSCQVVYIPTVWPTERQRHRKRRQQIDREGIDGNSTDVWTKNIVQRYEERPASLEQVYLVEFAFWYANANDFVDEENDEHADDDEDSEAVPKVRTSSTPKEYRRRQFGRVIRYRRYDIDDTDNYKREMVLLYVAFRNEMSEIVDQNKFLQLFNNNKDTIMQRHSLFDTNLNIENVIKEHEAMMILKNEDNSNLKEEESP